MDLNLDVVMMDYKTSGIHINCKPIWIPDEIWANTIVWFHPDDNDMCFELRAETLLMMLQFDGARNVMTNKMYLLR